MSGNEFVRILIAVLGILLVILGPVATIWSLNTLFPVLAIPINFDTWVAALVIAGLFRTTITRN